MAASSSGGKRALLATGLVLAGAGVLGFFTYADDLRHGGELATAGALVLAGLALLGAANLPALALHRVAIAILAGLLAGSLFDAAMPGVACGFALGVLLAWHRHLRAQPALPIQLHALAALYFVASLAHFAHNAENLEAYPNLPAWLTREGVYLAWLAVTAVGALGAGLAWRGKPVASAACLVLYGLLGLYGLAHYGRAPASHHSAAMNATIAFEAVTGLLLAIAAAWRALSRNDAAAPGMNP